MSEGSCSFSFELFPPRSANARASLLETIDVLASTRPDFISVTYGAGGSSRESSLELLRHIRSSTAVEPMAHLTCVGSSHEQANRLVREFLDAGISSFLAVRGDPPAGTADGEDFLGDLKTASELVQLIHRVQKERAQYATVTFRGHDGIGHLRDAKPKVRVAVAAFPNGHPRSRRLGQDIDVLLAKQTSGATMAITQLFFHAADYLEFTDAAKNAGVTIPIVPGLMPVTSPARLSRILELSGEREPMQLAQRLISASTTEEQFAIGVEYSTALAAELLAGGAPSLHLYTHNQHQAVLSVLNGVGALTQRN
jgi:methylenetetrahydrofolate reductase (NADPH)